MKTEYLIVTGHVLIDLMTSVRQRIDEGWQPLGGPFNLDKPPCVGQALVRHTTVTEDKDEYSGATSVRPLIDESFYAHQLSELIEEYMVYLNNEYDKDYKAWEDGLRKHEPYETGYLLSFPGFARWLKEYK